VLNDPQFCCRSRIRRIITPITTTEYPTQVMAVSIHFFFLFIKFSAEAARGGTAEVEIAYEVPLWSMAQRPYHADCKLFTMMGL
jgi:hypothetical protein